MVVVQNTKTLCEGMQVARRGSVSVGVWCS
jgi:hypothetical protein